MWLCDSSCPEDVSEAWECGLAVSIGYPIKYCLQSCTDALTRWYKAEFGHVGRRISSLKTQLQCLESQPNLHGDEIRRVQRELNLWLDSEEVKWKQRSRNLYLEAGDRNTRFFHMKASTRHQKNLMEGLEDSSGS